MIDLDFLGIPLTIQSNRPSSRSSQRSSGSIGSYTGRRSSGAQTKGVPVSQSRTGASRSAAILLISYHLSNIKDHQSSSSSSNNKNSYNYRSNELMTKYIEQQLEDQKKLLYLEIPALKNHNNLMRKLRLNLKSESDLEHFGDTPQDHLGRSPLHKKLHRKLFSKNTTITTTTASLPVQSILHNDGGKDNDYIHSSTLDGSILDGSSEIRLHNNSYATTGTSGGYTNPIAYSIEDLDEQDNSSTEDDDEAEYQRCYFYDNREIIIGALPTPSECYAPTAVISITH